MQFATFILTHNNPSLTLDTADSIKFWMTDKILIVVDSAGWHHYENTTSEFEIIRGLRHGLPKSPFRNVCFGLLQLYKRYPDVDWFCYCEQDVLFISDLFKQDLKSGHWLYGCDMRPPDYLHQPAVLNLDLLNDIVGDNVKEEVYVLGAIMFMHRKFVKKLVEENILSKIIKETNGFESGFFPGYNGYAFEEIFFASLCNHFKHKSVKHLTPWARYPIRWHPEIQPNEVSPGASIVHPLKQTNNKIRTHYAKFRRSF